MQFLLLIISGVIGFQFGSRYRLHIILGTLPLLFCVSLALTEYSSIRLSFGSAGLYFSNLLVFTFASSQSFRKQISRAESIQVWFLAFIFLGLCFAVSLGLQSLGSAIPITKNIELTNIRISPLIFIATIFFFIGYSNIKFTIIIVPLFFVFIISLLSSSMHIDSEIYYTTEFDIPIAHLIYAKPSNVTFFLISLYSGSVFRKWVKRIDLTKKEISIYYVVLSIVLILSTLTIDTHISTEYEPKSYSTSTVESYLPNFEDRIGELQEISNTPRIEEPVLDNSGWFEFIFETRSKLFHYATISMLLFIGALRLGSIRALGAIVALWAIVYVTSAFNYHTFSINDSLTIIFRPPISSISFGGLTGFRAVSYPPQDYIFAVFGLLFAKIRSGELKWKTSDSKTFSFGAMSPAKTTFTLIGLTYILALIQILFQILFSIMISILL